MAAYGLRNTAYGMPGKRGSGLGEVHSLTLMATERDLGDPRQPSHQRFTAPRTRPTMTPWMTSSWAGMRSGNFGFSALR